MTQSFDDAWKENRHVWESTKNLAKAMYLAGAQSKQAEIDECKEVASSIEDAYLREKTKVDELRKRIDDALRAMEAESENSWGLWKEKADMYEQGASNAYEKSYWILKGTTNEQ